MVAVLSKIPKLQGTCSVFSRSNQVFAAFYTHKRSLRLSSTLPADGEGLASQADVPSCPGSTKQHPNMQGGNWGRFLLFLPGAITFGLGTWQIFRRQEKVTCCFLNLLHSVVMQSIPVIVDGEKHQVELAVMISGHDGIKMLDYRKGRLEMEPVSWNEAGSLGHNLENLEFRKVICEGTFDEDKTIFLGPRSRSISGVTENGYYIITPFVPKSGESGSVQLPILVNRGWVPRGWRTRTLEDSQVLEKSSDSESTDGHQTRWSIWWKFWSKQAKVSKDKEPTNLPIKVVGVVRGSEKPSIFVPENNPTTGQWFYVDIPMISRACGLPDNSLYIEDINDSATATNPYPVPKDVNTLIHYSVMPQDHLNYTLTWYSLSAAVTYMAFKRIRPKRALR
ncbi:Surfeit locus protein 1 [Apostasia shenzhenica]|uniref:SURF1-like protein n=1 Tax=Apostasia shenzhenica TaxID=1088818 RepID=A0A2I0AW65_9ASPA|nr:Surfeit locus protein 1 [Apostasia shenzhenica]